MPLTAPQSQPALVNESASLKKEEICFIASARLSFSHWIMLRHWLNPLSQHTPRIMMQTSGNSDDSRARLEPVRYTHTRTRTHPHTTPLLFPAVWLCLGERAGGCVGVYQCTAGAWGSPFTPHSGLACSHSLQPILGPHKVQRIPYTSYIICQREREKVRERESEGTAQTQGCVDASCHSSIWKACVNECAYVAECVDTVAKHAGSASCYVAAYPIGLVKHGASAFFCCSLISLCPTHSPVLDAGSYASKRQNVRG